MRRLEGMLIAVTALGLLLVAGMPPVGGAEDPKGKKASQGDRGGAGGKARGGSGGDGGAGGSGSVIQLPNLSDKEIAALERTMTPEQKKLLDEYVQLQAALYARSWGEKGTAPTAAELRKQEFAEVVYYGYDPKSYWERLPEMVKRLHKSADPFFVSAEERKAAEKLPPGFAAEVEKLVSDDLDIFFAARRKVVIQGPGAYALVADLARKVTDKKEELLTLRLSGLLKELERQQVFQEIFPNKIRIVEQVYRRAAELRKKPGGKKIAALISRGVAGSGSQVIRDHGYEGTCYLNFPVNENGHEATGNLMFDNGIGEGLHLHSNSHGGLANRIQDLGPVDFAGVKKAPAASSPSWGSSRDAWNKGLKAVAGHVYLEHCREDGGGVGLTVKFKVIEVKAREYVILEWEVIPQEK